MTQNLVEKIFQNFNTIESSTKSNKIEIKKQRDQALLRLYEIGEEEVLNALEFIYKEKNYKLLIHSSTTALFDDSMLSIEWGISTLSFFKSIVPTSSFKNQILSIFLKMEQRGFSTVPPLKYLCSQWGFSYLKPEFSELLDRNFDANGVEKLKYSPLVHQFFKRTQAHLVTNDSSLEKVSSSVKLKKLKEVKKPKKVKQRAVEELLNDVLNKDLIPHGLQAIELLGDLSSTAKDVVPTLVRVVENGFLPSIARKKAIISLGKIGKLPKEAKPCLLNSLQHEELKNYAAIALVQISGAVKEAIPILIEALDSPNTDISEKAQMALMVIGPRALSPVIEALNDNDTHHRAETILKIVVYRLIQRLKDCSIFQNETEYLHETIEKLIQINNQNFEAYQSAARLLKDIIDTLIATLEEKKETSDLIQAFTYATLKQLIFDEERRLEVARKLGCVDAFETNKQFSLLKEKIAST